MKMTLEEVKADIKSGKSHMIFYAANTAWWTHLDSDLEEATNAGKNYRLKKFREGMAIMGSNQNSVADSIEMDRQLKISELPMDPTGSVLFQTDNPEGFILKSEASPEHFGKHGLDAFMKSHHQNCGGQCFSNWDKYNELLDQEE